MPKLIFVDSEGTEKSVEAENGLSVMEVARDNDLEIEGTCGGSISCCTCHVIIDKDWFSIVGGPCLLYTSPSPRDLSTSRMPSSA